MNYPTDCIQAHVDGGDWWIETTDHTLARGRLIWTFIADVTEVRTELVPTGKSDGVTHHELGISIRQFDPAVDDRPKFPIPSMNLAPGDRLLVAKAKRRLAVVVWNPGLAATIMVAPVFSVPPALVSDCRRAQYPQYIWDKLPIGDADESIIRLDQIQPISRHPSNLEITKWQLSEPALFVLADWVAWFTTGALERDSDLAVLREVLAD